MLDISQDRPRMPWWIRLPVCAVVGCGLAVLTIAIFLHFQQHSLIYHPRPYSRAYEHVLPPNGVEMEYALPFGQQVAFYIPSSSEPPKRVWVAFCGNGSLALDWTGLLSAYPPNGDAFLLVDYPGYGKNSGYATMDSTRATAEGALRALAARLHVNEEQIQLCTIGHSLGAAVALDFATRHPVQRIIVAAPFTNLREEAATVVGQYLAYLLKENYDNRESIRAIFKRNPHVRIDIFHGTDDEVIPVRMGRALAQEFPLIRYHEVRAANHTTVMNEAQTEMIAAMSQ